MTRQTFLFSFFVFIAAVFFSASSVLAQGYGLIQDDYKRYAQLFKQGKDPDLGPDGSQTWRTLYRNHQWKTYAEGNEFRDPLQVAQTLTGIYLTSLVDSQVSKQIDDIIVSKAALGTALSERITLDLIGSYLDNSKNEALQEKISQAGTGDDFTSEMERLKMEYLNRDLDVQVRKRIVSPNNIATNRIIEIRGTRSMFQSKEKDWASTYYYMRERFNLLNDLAGYFPFNWTEDDEDESEDTDSDDDTRRKLQMDQLVKRLKRLKVDTTGWREELEDEAKAAQTSARSGMGSGGMSSDSYDGTSGAYPYNSGGGAYPTYNVSGSSSSDSSSGDSSDGTPEGFDGANIPPALLAALLAGGAASTSDADDAKKLEKAVDLLWITRAKEELKATEDRYKAFKYIVGVYQDSGFHMETLQKIHDYYLSGAEDGDPIAQYHFALFIRYLGDVVNPYEYPNADACRTESDQWLAKAKAQDVAKKRVEDLEVLLAKAVNNEERRIADYGKKYKALVKVEEDKIDMYEDVLIRVRQRIGNNTGGTGGGRNNSGGGIGGNNRGSGRNNNSGGYGNSSSSSSDYY